MGRSAMEVNAGARRKGGLWRRWEVIALQGAFILWVVWTVGGGLWQANSAQQWTVPHTLGDLTMKGNAVQGAEAVGQMTRLHGKDVEIEDGYVAHYYAAGREAVLYVGMTKGAAVADNLTERMRSLIEKGNSPFKDLATRKVDGRSVFRVVGMGAEHYFFAQEDKAVWLTVAGGRAEEALRATFDGVK